MKISTNSTNRILGVICALLLLTPLAAFAQNRVVVIPLFDGACASGTCKPLKNIVTVAKANGMFADPVAAVNSITDASDTNPYLVVIGPGVYTVTVPIVMKPYVEITGSGETVTKIKGAISTESESTSAIVRGANRSALSFLTVENTGGVGIFSIALYNDHVSPKVSNVIATATGGTANYGVHNGSSSPEMTNVTASAAGGEGNYGVYNTSSSPVMMNVTATVTGGTTNFGVSNNSSSPEMTSCIVTASGGTNNYGVANSSSSSPVMTNVTATASGGTYSYGVYNTSSSPVIRRSSMKGDIDGLKTEGSGTTTVSQSTIINEIGGAGVKKCVACDNGAGKYLNRDDCSVIP